MSNDNCSLKPSPHNSLPITHLGLIDTTLCCGSGSTFVQLISWTLRWRHNGRDGVSNHQPHDCLLNRLFGHRSKKTSKLRVTGLCAGNSPGPGEFPAQMASNAENVSIWWRHLSWYLMAATHYLNNCWLITSQIHTNLCLGWIFSKIITTMWIYNVPMALKENSQSFQEPWDQFNIA